LGGLVSGHDHVEGVGHRGFFFHDERQTLTKVNPVSVCHKYVMQQRPQFLITSGGLVPSDRVQ
jgi:hypothetical protein